jgi:hypothetical protein
MVGLVAVALVAVAVVVQARGGPDHDDSSRGSAGSEGTSAAGPATTGTTLVPPDVDEPRASVDLAATPAGDDPVELARWWAATYTAYIGAEAPAALADRLASTSTASLRAGLTAIPPAASYDEPAAIEGVSNRPPVGEDGRTEVRVTVETGGALTTYDLTLVAATAGGSGPTGWLVDEATRL